LFLQIATTDRGFGPWLSAALVIATAITCGSLPACSPYVFSNDVQTLSTKTASIDASYQENKQKTLSEQYLSRRIDWVRRKPMLMTSPGCDVHTYNIRSMRCDLIEEGGLQVTINVISADDPSPPAVTVVDICEAVTDLAPAPTASPIGVKRRLERADVFRAMDNYTAALAAITKAQDRAEFDAAAAKLSTAVGELAGPYASVAKASSNAGLWIVGQDLDYRRLQELRDATSKACRKVHELTAVMRELLDETREDRLDVLHVLLERKKDLVNAARNKPHISDEVYATAIDEAQSTADAFNSVRAADPKATAEALSDAHDAFFLAVRNNEGATDSLVVSLQTFANKANDIATAAGATASGSTGKKF
jgi:hypothetical protein